MGIFGWSYPPGCNSVPGDEPDPPCEICGLDPDLCICPECPECGEYGNKNCYLDHGLRRSEEQKFSKEIMEREWQAEAQNETWEIDDELS